MTSPAIVIPDRALRTLVLVGVLHLWWTSASLAENFFDTRWQYYAEDHDRIRVDSSYSLFAFDLSDSLLVDGSLLYSKISGASPIGTPPDYIGGPVPTANLTDERYAFTLGATKIVDNHALKIGLSYSYESDYKSAGGSIQDTVSLNEKNTELVFGFAYTKDRVGANNDLYLNASKRSYDWLVGINQVLGPNTLLNFNAGMGLKQGYLSEPYKSALIDGEEYADERPNRKLEELVFIQLTHMIDAIKTSAEISYRFGHNDFGITSHTLTAALYKDFFDKRLVVRPLFRYYTQNAADFYATEFTGDPQYFSADYRISALHTFTYGLQLRWNLIADKASLNLGYERYLMRGTDGVTSQSAYANAHAITGGVLFKF